jgi:hypothetical protein
MGTNQVGEEAGEFPAALGTPLAPAGSWKGGGDVV